MFQQPRPGSVRLPARKALVDGLPGPVALGQITPRSPGPQPPQHTVDHLAVITPRATTPIHLRQQGLYPRPRRVRQLASTCHKINYQTRLRANLGGAHLTGANLTGAALGGAALGRAYLARTNLTGANLAGADLLRARLSGACLIEADLTGARLVEADLTGADLTGADLTAARLGKANLTSANVARANLAGANLVGAKLTSALWHIRTTVWPATVAERVLAESDEVEPGVYRVQGGSSPDRSTMLV